MSIPPIGRLEGCQMSKHDNIRDEESGSISELYEGHVLNHLSQRVSVYGKVLNDSGNGVADVRLVGKAQESPIVRASALARFVHHGRLRSLAIARGRLDFQHTD